jgi:hypothetical protein
MSKLLTIDEASQYLGTSKLTLYGWGSARKRGSIWDRLTKRPDSYYCPSTSLRRERVDRATAMKIVGHKSEMMWMRYNAIDERDLTQAAQKVHKYLQENTPGTLAETLADYSARK